jgi:hypothetical protein
MRVDESMRADEVHSNEPLRHGAYLCLSVPDGVRRIAAAADVPGLADRLGLRNEFDNTGGDPAASIAYLRRVSAAPGDLADGALQVATALVHVAAATAEPVAAFCSELARLLGSAIPPRVLAGVVRPTIYTGNAMHNFAYAHRVLQQPGGVMPNAFLVPTSKTAAWWQKDWMERHTYFLPRYDDAGRKVRDGHALAAAAGVECLLRRTYKHTQDGPASAGEYDFLNYFECADEDVPTFHAVCAALRDVAKNPEWAFVREGPTWQGRRVAAWEELFA